MILVVISAIGSIIASLCFQKSREKIITALSELSNLGTTIPILLAWLFCFIVFLSFVVLILLGKDVHFGLWFGLGVIVFFLIIQAVVDSENR